jgi:hypothetical protein
MCGSERRAKANLWVKASKQNYDGTKTGAYARFRDKHGRYLLTGHAVSGAEQA